MKKKIIEIDDSARSQFLKLSKFHNKKVFKLWLKSTGCAGSSYKMDFIDEESIKKFDEIVTIDDIKLVVDSSSIMSLIGTQIKWINDGINQKFDFINPNVKEDSMCGCGESFQLK